jgi:hypothetical protein
MNRFRFGTASHATAVKKQLIEQTKENVLEDFSI